MVGKDLVRLTHNTEGNGWLYDSWWQWWYWAVCLWNCQTPLWKIVEWQRWWYNDNDDNGWFVVKIDTQQWGKWMIGWQLTAMTILLGSLLFVYCWDWHTTLREMVEWHRDDDENDLDFSFRLTKWGWKLKFGGGGGIWKLSDY